jgi:hypothetical protein
LPYRASGVFKPISKEYQRKIEELNRKRGKTETKRKRIGEEKGKIEREEEKSSLTFSAKLREKYRTAGGKVRKEERVIKKNIKG